MIQKRCYVYGVSPKKVHRAEEGGDDEFWEMLCFPYRLIHLTGHQFSLRDLLKYCYKQRRFLASWLETKMNGFEWRRGNRIDHDDVMQFLINGGHYGLIERRRISQVFGRELEEICRGIPVKSRLTSSREFSWNSSQESVDFQSRVVVEFQSRVGWLPIESCRRIPVKSRLTSNRELS
jgi:hypothetical protein